MEKPLICGKTAKTYKFWDNLIYHYKHLYPLYGTLYDNYYIYLLLLLHRKACGVQAVYL